MKDDDRVETASPITQRIKDTIDLNDKNYKTNQDYININVTESNQSIQIPVMTENNNQNNYYKKPIFRRKTPIVINYTYNSKDINEINTKATETRCKQININKKINKYDETDLSLLDNKTRNIENKSNILNDSSCFKESIDEYLKIQAENRCINIHVLDEIKQKSNLIKKESEIKKPRIRRSLDQFLIKDDKEVNHEHKKTLIKTSRNKKKTKKKIKKLNTISFCKVESFVIKSNTQGPLRDITDNDLISCLKILNEGNYSNSSDYENYLNLSNLYNNEEIILILMKLFWETHNQYKKAITAEKESKKRLYYSNSTSNIQDQRNYIQSKKSPSIDNSNIKINQKVRIQPNIERSSTPKLSSLTKLANPHKYNIINSRIKLNYKERFMKLKNNQVTQINKYN